MSETDISAVLDELAALRAEVAPLRERVSELEAREPDQPTGERAMSRRSLFGLAGAGVASAAVLATASPAAAADGGAVLIGELAEQDDVDDATVLRYSRATAPIEDASFVLENTDAASTHATALIRTAGLGHALEVDQDNVDAVNPALLATNDGAGAALQGNSVSGYGVIAEGGLAPLRLVPAPDPLLAAAPADGDHEAGELYSDSDGNLYYCTEAGTPGTWTKLNDQTAGMLAPTFLATPERAFDSRAGREPSSTDIAAKGQFSGAENREIDLTVATSLPAGATAAIVNLTVVDTASSSGFASIYSGASPDLNPPTFSNINWFGPGQILANTTTTAVGPDGTVKVYTSSEADVIVDLIGYY